MRAEQEVLGGGFVVDEAPVEADGDEEAVPVDEGALVDAAAEVGTELGGAELDDVAVVPPAVVGAGLEHAPIMPATPTSASIVAAGRRQGRLVRGRRRLTARA